MSQDKNEKKPSKVALKIAEIVDAVDVIVELSDCEKLALAISRLQEVYFLECPGP